MSSSTGSSQPHWYLQISCKIFLPVNNSGDTSPRESNIDATAERTPLLVTNPSLKDILKYNSSCSIRHSTPRARDTIAKWKLIMAEVEALNVTSSLDDGCAFKNTSICASELMQLETTSYTRIYALWFHSPRVVFQWISVLRRRKLSCE